MQKQTKLDAIEELADEGLNALSYSEIDNAEQKFRDILEVIDQ